MAPQTRRMTKGKGLVQPRETTTSKRKWEMVEESQETDEEGYEQALPGRNVLLQNAKKLAKEINIISKSEMKKLTNILRIEGLSGGRSYEEAIQLLLEPKSTVHKSIEKRNINIIAESVGAYILKVLHQVFKFLIELQHIQSWDGEVAEIIVKGIEKVPKLIGITIQELDNVIDDAKYVCNTTSDRWQLRNAEALRNSVFEWKIHTALEETIEEWVKCPTQILKIVDWHKKYEELILGLGV